MYIYIHDVAKLIVTNYNVRSNLLQYLVTIIMLIMTYINAHNDLWQCS